MNPARIGVFVAGDTGQVGREFVAQLQDHIRTHHTPLTLLGTANTRRMRLPNGDWRTRTGGDWNDLLAALAKAAPVVFADCTASETVAGLYPALLARGIGIVTPNKIAFSGSIAQYRRLHALAEAHRVPLLYETTVGAALPVLAPIAALRARGETLIGVHAALSGTLSLLCARLNAGVALSRAVAEAREKGFTEPHPGRDLAGGDAHRKLTILLRTAGIPIEPADIALAPMLAPAIADAPTPETLLARLQQCDGEWLARAAKRPLAYLARYDGRTATVGLASVSPDSPFAQLAPGENRVHIHTAQYRAVPLMISGPGAGAAITAAGLLGDLMQAAREFSRDLTARAGKMTEFVLS